MTNNSLLSNLRDMMQNMVKINDKKKPILFSSSTMKKDLNHCTIEEILPHLLVYSSVATIESKEKIWVATSMLVRFLATHTNNLVAIESDAPVGMLGSKEVLQGLYSNPIHDFFSEQIVHNIMSKDIEKASPKMRVYDLLKKMNGIGRDFALIQTTDGEFSTISARRLLEVGILCDTRIKVSDMPSKKVVTFQKDDNIGFLIGEMLRNNTDVVILEHTPLFVTPQTIFEKISELNYLDGINDFLDSKVSTLNLKTGRII